MSEDGDESDKHLEARDRRYSCLINHLRLRNPYSELIWTVSPILGKDLFENTMTKYFGWLHLSQYFLIQFLKAVN